LHATEGRQCALCQYSQPVGSANSAWPQILLTAGLNLCDRWILRWSRVCLEKGMAGPSIVALVVTKGMSDFLSNSLSGLMRVGIDPRTIHVARPDNAADEVDPILRRADVNIHSFSEFSQSSVGASSDTYANYGTRTFIDVNWSKVYYLLWLLQRHDHVVYADVDVGWIANPLPYLRSVSKVFPLAFQTESHPAFPPVLCWGFLAFRRSYGARRFLRALLKIHRAQPADKLPIDEQASCATWLADHPRWFRKIYLLPETLFLNGMGYRNLTGSAATLEIVQGSISPFVFHANWTVGLENKRALMRQTGTWLLD
jgi:hypothetical protein